MNHMRVCKMARGLTSFQQKNLDRRSKQGNLRVLRDTYYPIDFCSNDYLGFARKKLGCSEISGATGSRLISGHKKCFSDFENQLAVDYSMPAALFYNSGYNANLGLACLFGPNDILILDEHAHASLKAGAKTSQSKTFLFKHNNLEHLETRLQSLSEKADQCYVIVESVYSMDGDFAPLPDICQLAKKYKARVIVDEAHAVGVFGPKGMGRTSHYRLDKEVFIKTVTFGKSYGLYGAALLCSEEVKEYLINFSLPLIYTTALPPQLAEAVHKRHVEVRHDQLGREQVFQLINHVNKKYNQKIQSPIFPVVIGDVAKVKKICAEINQKGIGVVPIYSPTVRRGTERIRVCLHSFNKEEEVDQLFDVLRRHL